MSNSIPISGLNYLSTVKMADFIPIVQSGSVSTMTTYRTPISSLSGLFSISSSVLSSSWASASISASYTLTGSYSISASHALTSSYSISSSFATSASWAPQPTITIQTSVASASWASGSLTSISASWASGSLSSISSSWASSSLSASWASNSLSSSYAKSSSYANQAATASCLSLGAGGVIGINWIHPYVSIQTLTDNEHHDLTSYGVPTSAKSILFYISSSYSGDHYSSIKINGYPVFQGGSSGNGHGFVAGSQVWAPITSSVSDVYIEFFNIYGFSQLNQLQISVLGYV